MPPPLPGAAPSSPAAAAASAAAAALALAAAGADVAITFRERAADAGRRAPTSRRSAAARVSVQVDVADRGRVAAMLAERRPSSAASTSSSTTPALARPAAIDRVGAAEWDEAIAVNLTSAFLITQGVVAGMRARRWGRLIFLSSVAAQVGGVVGPHYAASKAGLHGLMHVYAAHLAKEGVTANAIAPALIETEMVTSNPNAKPGIIPVGRFGDVDEVASVVRLLAENAYLTGQTINVNGGWYPS